MQKLTRPDLDKLLIALRDGGTVTAKGHARQAWSPRSLNKAVDSWRALLDYGVERRELARNVAAAMRKVPRIRCEMATDTPDEIRRVLRAADKDRSRHLWYLALSGLRRGEIAGLMWSDIDVEAGTVSISRNRVQAGAGVVLENAPKTLSSQRTLLLDDGLVTVLKRASARYAEERLALGAAHADSGYVAVNEAGEPYTPDTLTRMGRKLTKAAGVRPIRLHDARHSCGTALHLRGVPLAVIAKWLGHLAILRRRRASMPIPRTTSCVWLAPRSGRLSGQVDNVEVHCEGGGGSRAARPRPSTTTNNPVTADTSPLNPGLSR